VLGLYSRRVTRAGIWSGLAAGLALVSALVLSKRDPFLGLNAGFLGLLLNFAVVAVVSALTPAERSGFEPPAAAAVEA